MTNTWKEGTAADLLQYDGYVWVEVTDPYGEKVYSSTLQGTARRIESCSCCTAQIMFTLHDVPSDLVLLVDEDTPIRYSDDWDF